MQVPAAPSYSKCTTLAVLTLVVASCLLDAGVGFSQLNASECEDCSGSAADWQKVCDKEMLDITPFHAVFKLDSYKFDVACGWPLRGHIMRSVGAESKRLYPIFKNIAPGCQLLRSVVEQRYGLATVTSAVILGRVRGGGR